MAFLSAIGGGFGLRNTLIAFMVANIFIILVAAIINNIFPTAPFATIITAYTNLFLTTSLLFIAGTVAFFQIMVNVGLALAWGFIQFLWKLIINEAVPTFFDVAPSFDFSAITNVFTGLFSAIINQPLLFEPPAPAPVAAVVGGAITTAVVTNGTAPAPAPVTPPAGVV